MIFFVLVIDLSQKNLEDLVLLQTTFQQPDSQPPPDRPVLNVLQNGSVVYNTFVAHDPAVVDGNDYRRLKELLVGIRQPASPSRSCTWRKTPSAAACCWPTRS